MFKDFWRQIAAVVGRIKVSILRWRYRRIAGKLVPRRGDGHSLARINDDISLPEVMCVHCEMPRGYMGRAGDSGSCEHGRSHQCGRQRF